MMVEEYRKKAYKIAAENGFLEEEYSDKFWLTMIISELFEAIDADRNNRRANWLFYTQSGAKGVPLKTRYDVYISGTLEDELADACIRIFTYAEATGRTAKFCRVKLNESQNIPEYVYDIMKSLTHGGSLTYALSRINSLCEKKGIDIDWFMRQKMNYNELRGYKHGKKY